MTRRPTTTSLLTVALLTTNAAWLYHAIDFGTTHTYHMVACESAVQKFRQIKAILPVIVRPNSTRAEVVAAARVDLRDEPFERDGAVWVGQLGLKFTADGRFVEVVDVSD